MQPPDKNLSELLDEELVAYLDGQLDSESARQVENRLANEEPVRRRLQELARSWDLLDQLPNAVANETFTRSTVEMVALAAEEELSEQKAAEPRHRRWRWLWAGVAAAAAGLMGFFIAATVWSDPNEKLLRDLPVIENLEVLTQARDIDFLRKLNDEGLFTDDPTDSPGARDEGHAAKDAAEAAAMPESLDQRRELLDKMTAQEKEDLRAKFDKFQALTTDDQERLRRFNSQLDADSQEDRLRRIMLRFHEWLKTLLPTERADLLKADSKDRIAQIKTSRHEQEARLASQAGGPRFSRDDVDTLKNGWMEQFAVAHESELLSGLPPDAQRRIKGLDPAMRRKELAFAARQQWRKGANGSIGKTVTVTDADLQSLIDKLSPGLRDKLKSQATTQQRIQTVSGWMQAVTRPRWYRPGSEGSPTVSPEELNKFFQELPAAQRDQLMSLPRDEMTRELRQRYFREKRGPRGNGPHEGQGPHDRPRGEPRPDPAPSKPPKTPTNAETPPSKGETPAASSKPNL